MIPRQGKEVYDRETRFRTFSGCQRCVRSAQGREYADRTLQKYPKR